MLLRELLMEYDIECDCVSLENTMSLDMFAGEFVGQCSPLFRWAGGKSQLLSAIRFYAPKKFNTYFEPFVGGGALLFALMPDKAVINDLNKSIINLYKDVRDNYKDLVSMLEAVSKLPDTETVYLTVRDMYNDYVRKENYSVELSALFMYLNAKAFNSLYRVNGKGEFNVSYRKEVKVQPVYTPETLKYAHEYFLNNEVDILSGDFIKATERASKGDFVYFDPPYAPVSESKNFTGYTQDGFSVEDQERLAEEFRRLTHLGVQCIESNSDCELIRDLYKGCTIKTLNVNYYPQPTSDDIKRQEVLILNF